MKARRKPLALSEEAEFEFPGEKGGIEQRICVDRLGSGRRLSPGDCLLSPCCPSADSNTSSLFQLRPALLSQTPPPSMLVTGHQRSQLLRVQVRTHHCTRICRPPSMLTHARYFDFAHCGCRFAYSHKRDGYKPSNWSWINFLLCWGHLKISHNLHLGRQRFSIFSTNLVHFGFDLNVVNREMLMASLIVSGQASSQLKSGWNLKGKSVGPV